MELGQGTLGRTALLDITSVESALSMRDAIDLLEATLAHEARGSTSVSPKFITKFGGGEMRVLFASDSEAGYCAMKAYHRIDGVGTRYLVLLYSLKDGELVALLDGRRITDLRTGAASGVVARRVPITGPVTIGLVGSGNQARMQLESLAAVYDIASVAVYSPTVANREAFATTMSAKLGVPVAAVASAEAAVRGRRIVAAASKARGEPVVRGEWLDGCRLLCAVGNTRRDFAELDAACFRRSAVVVLDSMHAVEEAGELRQAVAAGELPESKRVRLADVVIGAARVPPEGLVVFKSVGMALEDLSLAASCYERLAGCPGIVMAPSVASLRAGAARPAA